MLAGVPMLDFTVEQMRGQQLQNVLTKSWHNGIELVEEPCYQLVRHRLRRK